VAGVVAKGWYLYCRYKRVKCSYAGLQQNESWLFRASVLWQNLDKYKITSLPVTRHESHRVSKCFLKPHKSIVNRSTYAHSHCLELAKTSTDITLMCTIFY
jgi:hypothetical protein